MPRSMAARARKRAVVLLSGGLDSTTCLAVARRDGFEAHCLSVDYGQRHKGELVARPPARARARRGRSPGREGRPLRLRRLGAHRRRASPCRRAGARGAWRAEIPVTYVPARNTVLLALALAHAETIGAEDVFVGRERDRLLRLPGLPPRVPAGVRAAGDASRRRPAWRGGRCGSTRRSSGSRRRGS